MNTHEKEQHFQHQKENMKKKYAGNIRSFCKYHGVDESVGWDMLLFNAKCFTKGIEKEIIPGGGKIDVPALIKDYKILEQFIVWQG